jgi:CheY-like chemotaxis protein
VSGANPRVLVIEDDALIRANLARWLKIEGYSVDVAENGTDGLAFARKSRPDVVICDLLMPGIDGYTVLAQLRAAAETACRCRDSVSAVYFVDR